MTIDTSTHSPPEAVLKQLLDSENLQNNDLIEIMGNVKPSRSTSSLASLIRGLFTKNSKLLSLLNATLTEFASYEDANEMDLFKGFVNEFIVWLDSDGMVLFEKYAVKLSELKANTLDAEGASTNINSEHFFKPIGNLLNYVNFIENATHLLRNPFILEQLGKTKTSLLKVYDTYNDESRLKSLNNISFHDIKAFGAPSPKSKTKTPSRVSSYFKVDQISERTGNEPLTLSDSKSTQYSVELALLNLNAEQLGQTYNALAILQVWPNQEEAPRSLMFPPFRVNELSINLENSSIVLKSISFSNFIAAESKLIISGRNQAFLTQWYKKLLQIFPSELNKTPVSEKFLIKPNSSPPAMSGLGINVLSDVEHRRTFHEEDDYAAFETPLNSSKSNTFKELIGSPSLSSSSPLSQLQQQFQQQPTGSRKSAVDDSVDALEPQPPFHSSKRKNSNSSVTSFDSSESIKSQYDRSLHIINKALTNTSIKSSGSHIKVVPREVLLPPATSEEELEFRPRSSQGEISFVEESPQESFSTNNDPADTNTSPYKNVFNSVPDLSNKKSIYQLSSGSGVDLSNFGKNHNPSFSIPKGLSDIAKQENEQEKIKKVEKPRRKSFFHIFKKTSKPPKIGNGSPRLPQSPMSVEGEDELDPIDSPVETTSKVIPSVSQNSQKLESSVDTLGAKSAKTDSASRSSSTLKLDLNPPSFQRGSSATPSDSSGEKSSNLPSPFALPSSTSTYFFKQLKPTSETPSLPTPTVGEESLNIPRELKDVINNDPSIDFFISPSSPKAMKISKWKQKYGKWEMITVNELLFIKIVANYELNKSWLIVFKEEFDEEYQEDADIPILLLDIDETTAVRQSSALDLQLQAVNSISREKILITIRCSTGALVESLLTNVNNIVGVLTAHNKTNKFASLVSSKGNTSDVTISSSIMSGLKEKRSDTSTLSSVSSHDDTKTNQPSKLRQEQSSYSISTQDISNAQIIHNPSNNKLLVLSPTTIRLQKQMASYDAINVLSSWKILSMYSLSIYVISDAFSNKNYYNMVLENNVEGSEEEDYSWLISEDDKFERIERIGKAGLLIKATDEDFYMVECRGKKEFKQLFEVF